MIKIFIPCTKKTKTNIRGFWRDNNKLYYDYLTSQHYKMPDKNEFYTHAENLKRFYNQLAIFYVEDDIGYIYYNKNKIDILSKRIYALVLKHNIKKEIKEAISQYGGVTIYKIDNKYFKEIFYK